MPRRRPIGILGLAGVLAGLGWGCARIEAPRGGPEDRDAPRIVGTVPDSGAVGVAEDLPLEITFSETMHRSSVRDWLFIAPWPGKLDCEWEGLTLSCRPVSGWAPDQAYTVLLGGKATDRRKNRIETPLQLTFTTGDSLPSAEIRGRVRTRALESKGVTVCLFPWPDEEGGPEARDPRDALRLGQTDAEGGFRLEFVPWELPLLLGAIWDENGNRVFDADEDLWAFSERPVFGEAPVAAADSAGGEGAELYLVYPEEPGDVSGAVVDSACAGYVAPRRFRAQLDSLGRVLSGELDAQGFEPARDSTEIVRLSAAEEESLRVAMEDVEERLRAAAADSAACDPVVWVSAWAEGDTLAREEVRARGDFSLRGLDPGLYRIRAFRDIDGNGRQGSGEPQGVFAPWVELLPGRHVEEIVIELGSGGDR